MISNLLFTAINASVKAGIEILSIYNSDFKVEIKSDTSPLTQADKRANSIINNYLLPTGIPIISEENDIISFETRKTWETCWIVDPLDGTKEFVKRNGEFTVNIALVKDGKPLLGVIYIPVSQTLYFSDNIDAKAYKLILKDHAISKEVANQATELSVKEKKSVTRVIGSRSHMNEETLRFIESLKKEGKETNIVTAGSSLKFCLIAEGKADVYPRFAPTMEWDTAAGQSICEAAGFMVKIKNTNKPLRYNKKKLLNPHFIVS
jgi:3'(2'), 5'-bisphosphate nucleotidase